MTLFGIKITTEHGLKGTRIIVQTPWGKRQRQPISAEGKANMRAAAAKRRKVKTAAVIAAADDVLPEDFGKIEPTDDTPPWDETAK